MRGDKRLIEAAMRLAGIATAKELAAASGLSHETARCIVIGAPAHRTSFARAAKALGVKAIDIIALDAKGRVAE